MTRWFSLLTVAGCLLTSPFAALAGETAWPDAFTGPWIGAYGGYGFASPSGTWSLTAPSIVPFPNVSSVLDGAGTGSISARGGLFGLQGGWNARLSGNIVVGVEADLGRYGLSGSRSSGGTVPVFNIPFTIDQSYSVDWQAALRLRAGYAFDNFALAFVEAGPALARIHYSSNFWDQSSAICCFDEIERHSASAFKLGLSLGAGAEFAVTKNLTVRTEYLYSHFPSLNAVGTTPLITGDDATVVHSSGGLNEHAFRVGLNYYFK